MLVSSCCKATIRFASPVLAIEIRLALAGSPHRDSWRPTDQVAPDSLDRSAQTVAGVDVLPLVEIHLVELAIHRTSRSPY